ncbi:MAG: squalene synthase HpnC [Opitutales bacterium]
MNLKEAYKKCVDLAMSHYENFPVARMMPKNIRENVSAVYAFARTSDDIADENHENIEAASEIRTKELELFESQLKLMQTKPQALEEKWAWIFIALADTTKKFDIPVSLYTDLTSAFKQDVVKKRYETFDDVLDYCKRSANPVGRLVLLLHSINDEKLFEMSDYICTALQLANFWQDMSLDWQKDRIYVPQEDWKTYNLKEEDFFKDTASKSMTDCVKFQCERTHDLFNKGGDLPKYLPRLLKLEIKLTLAGGRGILNKIAKLKYNTLAKRPSFNKLDKIKILLASIF